MEKKRLQREIEFILQNNFIVIFHFFYLWTGLGDFYVFDILFIMLQTVTYMYSFCKIVRETCNL